MVASRALPGEGPKGRRSGSRLPIPGTGWHDGGRWWGPPRDARRRPGFRLGLAASVPTGERSRIGRGGLPKPAPVPEFRDGAPVKPRRRPPAADGYCAVRDSRVRRCRNAARASCGDRRAAIPQAGMSGRTVNGAAFG